MRDAVRTHNTTHSSRCVWPRASLAPTHVARESGVTFRTARASGYYTLRIPHPHPTNDRGPTPHYTCRTAAHPQLLRHLHRKSCTSACKCRTSSPPALPQLLARMCQPQQVERTPAHARAKTRTILYAHGTRLNCADEAHARRALCMHEPWYRFLPWYALPRKPPCRPPPPSCLTPTLACALMRPSRRAPLKYCVGGGGRGRWQSR